MKADIKPYRRHLTSNDGLVTLPLGFRGQSAALALERKRRSEPFISQALALRIAASEAITPGGLAHVEGIRGAMLIASGVSRERHMRLRSRERAAAIQNFIKNSLVPTGPDFVEELVRRFLSAKEDTLAAAMRNAGDVLAQRKLSRALIARLTLEGTPYRWLDSMSNSWAKMPRNDADVELNLRGLSWPKGRRCRTIIFNLTVPFLANNVDVCLLDARPEDVASFYNSPNAYVALGELKGGIDPAGIDEHWKTARTALDHIREAFRQKGLKPHTFFIGAAIAKRMSGEIWDQLEEGGILKNAANLTDEKQLASISRWLCDL